MAVEKIDYLVILGDFRAKRAALDSLISAYENAQALGALGQLGEGTTGAAPMLNGDAAEPVELPVDAFRKKSIPAAIRLHLSAAKGKQTVREIAKALRDGGVESTAVNFDTLVSGTLNRLKGAGEVLRFKEGWALGEHFTEAFRARISQNQKVERKKKRKKQKPVPTAKIKAKSHEQKPSSSLPGLEHRIEAILRSDAAKTFNAAEIAQTLNVQVSAVSLSLGRMAAKHKAEKATGGYRAASAKGS